MIEIGRGALVILAGYAVMVVIVVLGSILLGAYFPGPTLEEPTSVYVYGALVCGFLAAMAGGWVTARLAARRPLLHVSVLAAVVVGLGVVTITSEARAGQPAWYPFAIVALGAAGAFLGGLIRARKVERVHA